MGPSTVYGDYSDPDVQARDKFVRECTVALCVDNAYLRPVQVLKNFCKETDAVVECRLKIPMVLEGYYKKRGPIPKLCQDAYLWFQKTYGMNCPRQCDKLMCKNTCKWLGIKSDLDKTEAELDAESDALREEMKTLQAKRDNVTSLKAELDKCIFQQGQGEVKVDRALKAVKEEEDALEVAGGKHEKASDIVDAQDAKVDGMNSALINLEEDLQELTQKKDMTAVELEGLEKEAERLQGVVDGKEEKLADANSQVVRYTKEKGQAESDVKEAGLSADKEKEKMDAQQADVTKWEKALAKAKDELAKVKSGEDPEQTLDATEDLVKQQRERLEAARDTMTAYEREFKKYETAGRLAGRKVDATSAKLSEAQAESQKLGSEVATANATFAKGAAAADAKKKVLEGLTKDVQVKTEEVAEMKKSLATAATTLEFAKESEADASAALKAAQGSKEAAEAGLGVAKQLLGDLEAECKGSNSTFTAADAELKAMDATTGAAAKALEGKVASNRAAILDHHKMKPEIVRQHGASVWKRSGHGDRLGF